MENTETRKLSEKIIVKGAYYITLIIGWMLIAGLLFSGYKIHSGTGSETVFSLFGLSVSYFSIAITIITIFVLLAWWVVSRYKKLKKQGLIKSEANAE